jgi:hypothetical protein
LQDRAIDFVTERPKDGFGPDGINYSVVLKGNGLSNSLAFVLVKRALTERATSFENEILFMWDFDENIAFLNNKKSIRVIVFFKDNLA